MDDHFSGKPGNVREFEAVRAMSRNLVKSGNFQEKCVLGCECTFG